MHAMSVRERMRGTRNRRVGITKALDTLGETKNEYTAVTSGACLGEPVWFKLALDEMRRFCVVGLE